MKCFFSEIIVMSTMVNRRFSPRDKEIFLSIMKTSEGGRFWNKIVVGDGDITNQDRRDAWVALANGFQKQWPS